MRLTNVKERLRQLGVGLYKMRVLVQHGAANISHATRVNVVAVRLILCTHTDELEGFLIGEIFEPLDMTLRNDHQMARYPTPFEYIVGDTVWNNEHVLAFVDNISSFINLVTKRADG